MKKLLVLAAVSAMAFGAQAAYEFSTCWFPAVNADSNPEDANAQYYQGYIINCSGDVAAALAYVQQQGVAGIQEVALAKLCDEGTWMDFREQYVKASATPSSLDIKLEETYAVLFYDSGAGVSEFLVMGAQEPASWLGSITFNDFISSGWQTYGAPTPGPVPEPTSGLLLLLGVAGLALKRKRA